MHFKNIIIIIFSAFAGVVLAFMANYFWLEEIIIPDPCYYHMHKPSKLFLAFYTLDSSEGGFHPYPTTFNFIFTITIGALGGFLLARYILRICKSSRQKKNKMQIPL